MKRDETRQTESERNDCRLKETKESIPNRFRPSLAAAGCCWLIIWYILKDAAKRVFTSLLVLAKVGADTTENDGSGKKSGKNLSPEISGNCHMV